MIVAGRLTDTPIFLRIARSQYNSSYILVITRRVLILRIYAKVHTLTTYAMHLDEGDTR
jgi:hypothetical protein